MSSGNNNRYLLLCGLIGPIILFSSTIILGLLFPGYDQVRDFISELGATDSPVMFYANVMFHVVGICFTAFGLGLFRLIKGHWSGRFGAVVFMIAGLFFTAIGLFPCPPGCEDASLRVMHDIASEGSMYIALLGIIFTAFYGVKEGIFSKKGTDWKWLVFVLAVALIFGSLGYTYPTLDQTNYGGLVQKAMLFTGFGFMAVMAFHFYRKEV